MCECAPGTVSKALNNSYGVSPKMRQRILEAAERLEYVPDTMARYMIKALLPYRRADLYQ